MARRRIDPEAGRTALDTWLRWREQTSDGSETAGAAEPDRATIATAVRYSLEEFAERHPGRSVEVRVPPFGVTQCIEGPTHTRGTPPNVVETDPQTWLAVVTGRETFADARSAGRISATGIRSDLSEHLPSAN